MWSTIAMIPSAAASAGVPFPFDLPLPSVRLPAEYAAIVNEYGEKFLIYMNPDLKPAERVTEGWPYASLEESATIAGAYVAFVLVAAVYYYTVVVKRADNAKKIDPSAKKVTKPVMQKFTDEPILIAGAIYNAVQVALCGYMMYGTVLEYQKENYQLICNPYNKAKSGMAAMLWVFYTSKILDFFDTIIMVARGTWRQFSFLHVYHHTSIFMIYWLNLNAGYDGDIYYTIVLNGGIHFVMYTYYFMAIFNIPGRQALRPLVTNSQLIQFVTMMGQAVYMLTQGCAFPHRITGMYLVYIFSLFLLFNNFKTKTYAKGKEGDKKTK